MIFANKFSENTQGIIYMVTCCFFISVMINIVRHLSQEFHIIFILMVRNFFAFIFFIPEIINDYQGLLKTKKAKLHLVRGINGLFAMMSWFYAISILPLSEAVSISFIIPILTTLAAMFFLGEKVKNSNWVSLLIGLFGVLIILRPSFKDLNTNYIFVFISVFLWTISNTLTKAMAKTEKPKTIVAYMSLIMLICSIPFAFPYMRPIDLNNLFWFVALGLISNLAHFSISYAYTKSDLSILQPFDFTRLIFTSIIAYFVFGEKLDIWVMIGSLVIFTGVITILPRKKLNKFKKIFLR